MTSATGNFPTLTRSRLVDEVYGELRLAIIRGEIAPSTELNQVQLAKDFGVSRGPIREALARLHASRLISVSPYQQYVVQELNSERVEELLQVREELEVLAVRRNFEQLRREPQLARLRELNGTLAAEGDAGRWLAVDLLLHRTLCGDGTDTAALVDDVRSRVQQYLSTVAGGQDRREQAEAEHDDIIGAIAEGSLDDCVAAVRTHIRATRRLLVATLEDGAQPTAESDGGEA